MQRSSALAASAAALALAGCSITTHEYAPAPAAQPAPRAAAGVAAGEGGIPTDVRRVTLIVRDIDRSLALYRDVLGLAVNYDIVTEFSGTNLPVGEPGSKGRLVLLNGNDPWIGWIGLIEMIDPPLRAPADYPKRLMPGSAVIIVNTDDADARCARAAQVPGVTVTGPARLQVYPGREGQPDIQVRGCNVLDPDGVAIEINQVLSQ